MDQQMTANHRVVLEAECDQLSTQLAQLAGEDHDPNFADRGEVAAELGEAHALADLLRDQLAHVERALARIDDGSYGSCEVCGGPIGAARLEALPSATVCIAHA